MIIESKTWMQRMKDRGYAGDPRQLHVKPPHFRVIKQAAADARKRRLKCWGKTQNRPMGEAAKQADDRLWSGKKTRLHAQTCRNNHGPDLVGMEPEDQTERSTPRKESAPQRKRALCRRPEEGSEEGKGPGSGKEGTGSGKEVLIAGSKSQEEG